MADADEMTALLGHESGLATQQPHRVSLGLTNVLTESLRSNVSSSGNNMVSLGLTSVLTESLRSNASSSGNNIPYCLPANSGTTREGCVMCRTRTRVVNFTDLDPGDHILMRGQICCLGCFYDHHAIVTDVQRCADNDNNADIYVVDVPSKGLEFVGCAYQGITHDSCCNRVYFPCCRCRFPVEEHKLLDRTWCKSDLKAQHVCRIDYHFRQNDKNTTKYIARQFCRIANDDDEDLEYNLLLKNCEHFTNACVNGPETPNLRCIEETISTQSHHCCWQIFLFIRWLFLIYFFAFHCGIFPSFMYDFIQSQCSNQDYCVAGLFGNLCHWVIILLFIVFFDMIYIFGRCAYYQPLHKRGFICEQCVRMVRLDGITRILALVLVDPFFHLDIIGQYDGNLDTLVGIVFLSLIGASLTDSFSSVITWVLGMCCFPTCRGACQFSKNFRFRCCARPVACCVGGLVRCVWGIMRCGRKHRRYVASVEEGNAIYRPSPESDATFVKRRLSVDCTRVYK